MASPVLVADYAHIYRRDSGGTWTEVYDLPAGAGPGDVMLQGLVAAKDSAHVVGTLAVDRQSSPSFSVLYSADAGLTWLDGGAVAFLNQQAYPNRIAIQEDGSAIFAVNADGTLGVFTSTDWGTTWDKIADDFSPTLRDRPIWVRDGFVWWMSDNGNTVTGALLGRCELDGSNRTSFATSPPQYQPQMNGSFDADLLFNWDSSREQEHSTIRFKYATDPDGTPTITTGPVIDVALDGFDYIPMAMTPLSATVGFVLLWGFAGALPDFRLYKTTDSGASWTHVQTDDDDTGQGGENGFPTLGIDYATAGSLWQPMTVPRMWHSTDSGDSWASEDVPGAADTDNAWTAVAVTSEAIVAARRHSFAWIVS